MANSSAVTAGDQATAAQYNALRADVLAGHFHDGVEGAAILAILFGDGSDGDVTISGNATLARDMRYRNLTVNAGVTLDPGAEVTLETPLLAQYAVSHYLEQERVLDADVVDQDSQD